MRDFSNESISSAFAVAGLLPTMSPVVMAAAPVVNCWIISLRCMDNGTVDDFEGDVLVVDGGGGANADAESISATATTAMQQTLLFMNMVSY